MSPLPWSFGLVPDEAPNWRSGCCSRGFDIAVNGEAMAASCSFESVFLEVAAAAAVVVGDDAGEGDKLRRSSWEVARRYGVDAEESTVTGGWEGVLVLQLLLYFGDVIMVVSGSTVPAPPSPSLRGLEEEGYGGACPVAGLNSARPTLLVLVVVSVELVFMLLRPAVE